MAGEETAEVVRRALFQGPVGLNGLATESGLSYDVLRSWRSGRRRPSAAGIRRLADGLEARAERLRGLAVELREALAQEQRETTRS